MTTTKYPKFREALLTSEPRAIARALVNNQVVSIVGLSLDDLPDTASLCNEVDEMESEITSWAGNPTDEQIASLRATAKQVAQQVVSEEMEDMGFDPEEMGW
jgi:hypothetical protein